MWNKYKFYVYVLGLAWWDVLFFRATRSPELAVDTCKAAGIVLLLAVVSALAKCFLSTWEEAKKESGESL